MILLLTLLAATIGVIVWWINYFLNGDPSYWKKHGIPYLEVPSFFQRIFVTKEFGIAQFDKQMYDQLGDGKFGGGMEFSNPTLLIKDLDLMKQIFIKDFDHFVNRRSVDLKKNDPHMNFALFNVDNEPWKELRAKMTPVFTTGKMRRMFDIFQSSATKMTDCVEKEASKKNCLELRPYMIKLTMDVIASAAFGLETNLFHNENSIFMKMALSFQETFAGVNFFKFFLVSYAPKICEFLNVRLTPKESDAFLSKIILDALEAREKAGVKRDDFLQLVLEARRGTLQEEDESHLDEHEKNAKLQGYSAKRSGKMIFTDDIVIAQSTVFILGGFETTEALLTFAIYEIGVHAGVQEKLYRELKKAADSNDGKFTYEMIHALEYMDMVVNETLRKYSIGVRNERKCTKPYRLPGSDFVVPTGMVVMIPTYAVHHDPKHWEEPEKFDPERFTKDKVAKRHPMAFQPFGHGPRNCIGNRFALSEAKVAMAHLVLNFLIKPCQHTVIPLKLRNQAIPRPQDNICMHITPRK